jgi:hypothetical protein
MSGRGERWEAPARSWSVWKIVGLVLAALIVLGGLVVLGFAVWFFASFSQWGSNK